MYKKYLVIKKTSFNEVVQHKSAANKEGVVVDPKTQYFGAYIHDTLVGFVGYMEISATHLRFKSDFVVKEFRGYGIYAELFKWRLENVDLIKYSEISAYCTQLSLPTYIKNNFETIKVIARGSTIVKLNLPNQ